jgi:molybdenum cofactor biosynthesis protein B
MREFISVSIAVLTVSDTRDLSTDKSGDALIELIRAAGHQVAARAIVKDDKYAIRAQASSWIADANINAIICTGGTGLTGRDGTPEALSVLFDKTIEGFGETFRQISWHDIGTSTIQSRATAGVANATYIFSLPGSTNACKTAWQQLLIYQLDYRTKPCNLVELMPRLLEK